MAVRVDPPVNIWDIPQGQSTYTPDEVIRLGNALYVYRNGRLVQINPDQMFNIPQGQTTYTPDNVIRVGNSLYSYENGVLKDITTDRQFDIPQGERTNFDIVRAGSGATVRTADGTIIPGSYLRDTQYDIPQGQTTYTPDQTVRRGNALYDYVNGILKNITTDRPYNIPQGQSASTPSREYGIPQGQSGVRPPGPYNVPQGQSTYIPDESVRRGNAVYEYENGVLKDINVDRQYDIPQGQRSDPVTAPKETVVRRGDQNYVYVDGVLRGVTPVSGNDSYQVQQNADAAYYTNVVNYNREEAARQAQAAAVAAARERALAPYRDLAATLLEQLGSGEYASAEQDLRKRLGKMSKRARKDINRGYGGLLKMISGQENPYANLQATQTEQPAQLAALLAQQGVGSNLLEQEIAAQQMANAGGSSAFADLANQLSAAWSANQQGLGNEARLQRRYAKDILASQRSGIKTQLLAREDAKRGDIEAQLKQIGEMGVDLPDNWNTLADRGKALRKLSKLSPDAQKYLRGLVGA